MVERNTSTGLEEFKGVVVDVVLEKNTFGDTDNDQYHLTMKPEGIVMKGKTGFIHEWVRLSAKATQKSVPEGSIIERYLSHYITSLIHSFTTSGVGLLPCVFNL